MQEANYIIKNVNATSVSSAKDFFSIEERSIFPSPVASTTTRKKTFDRKWQGHTLNCDTEIKDRDATTGIYFRSCSIEPSQCPNYQCIQNLS